MNVQRDPVHVLRVDGARALQRLGKLGGDVAWLPDDPQGRRAHLDSLVQLVRAKVAGLRRLATAESGEAADALEQQLTNALRYMPPGAQPSEATTPERPSADSPPLASGAPSVESADVGAGAGVAGGGADAHAFAAAAGSGSGGSGGLAAGARSVVRTRQSMVDALLERASAAAPAAATAVDDAELREAVEDEQTRHDRHVAEMLHLARQLKDQARATHAAIQRDVHSLTSLDGAVTNHQHATDKANSALSLFSSTAARCGCCNCLIVLVVVAIFFSLVPIIRFTPKLPSL